jgi:NADH:ubiquinone oxidoreductase subunit 4 (subunit M)
MNLLQRTVLALGGIALVAVWMLPATYHVNADGTRLESNWHWLWEVPLEWSVSVPLTALRLATVGALTVTFVLVFSREDKKEGK